MLAGTSRWWVVRHVQVELGGGAPIGAALKPPAARAGDPRMANATIRATADFGARLRRAFATDALEEVVVVAAGVGGSGGGGGRWWWWWW